MPASDAPVTMGRIIEWRTIGAVVLIAGAAYWATRSDVRSLSERIDRIEKDVGKLGDMATVIHSIDKRTAVMEERARKGDGR